MVEMMLGHLWGDYILQSNWMATRKSKDARACLVHCLIYTACVCAFLRTLNPLIAVLIFLSHYPIDRWGLAQKLLDLTRSRNLMAEETSDAPAKTIRVGFAVLVYTVADNTLHFTIMYLIYHALIAS